MQLEVALFPWIVGDGENNRHGEGFIFGYLFLPESSFAVRHNDP